MPHPGHESQPTSAREWSGAVPSNSTGLPILLEYLPWRLMFLGSFAETVDQERIVSGSASPPQPPQLRRHEGSPENDRSRTCPIVASAALSLTYRNYPARTRTLNEGTKIPCVTITPRGIEVAVVSPLLLSIYVSALCQPGTQLRPTNPKKPYSHDGCISLNTCFEYIGIFEAIQLLLPA